VRNLLVFVSRDVLFFDVQSLSHSQHQVQTSISGADKIGRAPTAGGQTGAVHLTASRLRSTTFEDGSSGQSSLDVTSGRPAGSRCQFDALLAPILHALEAARPAVGWAEAVADAGRPSPVRSGAVFNPDDGQAGRQAINLGWTSITGRAGCRHSPPRLLD